MCGIAGIMKTDGIEEPLASNLAAMSERMRDRGPDGEGFYMFSESGSRPLAGPETPRPGFSLRHVGGEMESLAKASEAPGMLFLAHRRLSIVDLSARAHQPMCAEDGRFWIVYNGETYNFRQIRETLKGEGENFFSDGDAELVLKAYRRRGPDCLKLFNGAFAFAIWDEAERELFCARDRLGEKPFYYSVPSGVFMFASRAGALHASGLLKAEPDMQGLFYGMGFGMAPRPMTAFKGVCALPQGHWMKVRHDGQIETRRYWRLPAGTQKKDMSAREAEELLDGELRRSVSMRLAADVPVGTFMSGGVDSTTVSAVASGLSPGIKAFTLSSSDPSLDETKEARLAAARHPMAHAVRDLGEEEILRSMDDLFETDEEPFCALDPNYFISKAVSAEGLKVALAGTGGDELFNGYRYCSHLGTWRLLKMLAPALKRVSGFGHPLARLACMAGAGRPEEFQLAVRSFLPDSEKRRLFSGPEFKGLDTIEAVRGLYVDGETEFSNALDAVCFMDLMNLLGNHHLHRLDQWTMRFSLEARLPLLDHEFVEAALSIPSGLKLRGGVRKWIFRRMASKYVPKECLDMRKKGFRMPNGALMKGPLRGLVSDALAALSKREAFDAKAVRRTLREWELGLRSHRGVWQLAATEMWFRKHVERRKA